MGDADDHVEKKNGSARNYTLNLCTVGGNNIVNLKNIDVDSIIQASEYF